MKIFNTDWIIDLEKSILWQYDKSAKLKSLIEQKQTWYKENVTDFITNYFKNIFNLKTANDFGLAVWGKLLNFPRQIKNKNDNTLLDLSTEQYRFLLQAQVLKFKMNCTIPEINRYLRIIFNEPTNKNVKVIDNHDMTITYFLNPVSVSEEIRDLIENYDFLPCPTGVSYTTTATTVYYKVIINHYPATAEVVFNIDGNEYIQDTIEVATGTTLTYTVRDIENGFETKSGTITVTEDTNISVTLDTTITISTLDSGATITLTINGTTYTATETITKTVSAEDTYSYSVAKVGYPTKSGNGTITEKLDLNFRFTDQQIMNITDITNGTIDITTIQDITLSTDCILDIDISGGYGWDNDDGYTRGGRVTIKASFNENDVLSARKVRGQKRDYGIGVGLWLNNNLILVAGGGAFNDRGSDRLSVGGSGYIGGKAEQGGFMTAKNGIGIISGTSKTRNIEDGNACGSSGYTIYGGQGYIASGYTNTATTKARSLGYISIIQKTTIQI